MSWSAGWTVAELRAFGAEVHGGACPSAATLVSAGAEVVAEFRDWLASQA